VHKTAAIWRRRSALSPQVTGSICASEHLRGTAIH
jgi:hypothetical protein